MERIVIIAEAGVNHNGSLELAKRLVDEAADCGADMIKFQTAKAESLVSRHAAMAEYQVKNTGQEESQLEMLKKLLLSYSDFEELAAYCKKKQLPFLSTPFDLESIAFLETFSMPFWKVPSGEITNYPYLCAIGRTKKPVVLSTGMSTLTEIEEAVCVLKENGTEKITLLHCNTEYPTPLCDVNLRAMKAMEEHFRLPTGYSDHTEGMEIPIAAAALGAVMLEKHFTLDKKMPGPDHKASLEPRELKQMIEAVRRIETALGSSRKEPSPSELKNREIARKSIVAKKAIRRGERFSEENLTTKRPGSGISPMEWRRVLGRESVRDFEEDELIELSDTERQDA